MATHSGILAWRIAMDRGVWWTTVHWVTKSWTQLSPKTQKDYDDIESYQQSSSEQMICYQIVEIKLQKQSVSLMV